MVESCTLKDKSKFIWGEKVCNKSKGREGLHLLFILYSKPHKTQRECWKKSNVGWMKLNTDGSIITSQIRGGIGGVLRYDTGEWIWGFSLPIQSASVIESKLRAIKEGLNEAWERRYQKIEAESDFLEAVQMILGNDGVVPDSVLLPLVEDANLSCIYLGPLN